MPSTDYCIKNCLNIKDKNITFSHISFGTYRNRQAKFYHAYAYADHCLICGSDNIIYNGYSTVNIRYLTLDASLPVFIKLSKQRMICKDCGKNSMAETTLSDKYCHLSNAIKSKVLSDLTEDWSIKSIAR